MDEVDVKESWNKKRIFAALFCIMLLAIGGYFFKTNVLGEKSVKGAAVKEETNSKNSKTNSKLNVNLPQVIKDKLEGLKQEVTHLSVEDIASSSPQIRKILNDIKALEQYPTNQARELCKQICSF